VARLLVFQKARSLTFFMAQMHFFRNWPTLLLSEFPDKLQATREPISPSTFLMMLSSAKSLLDRSTFVIDWHSVSPTTDASSVKQFFATLSVCSEFRLDKPPM